MPGLGPGADSQGPMVYDYVYSTFTMCHPEFFISEMSGSREAIKEASVKEGVRVKINKTREDPKCQVSTSGDTSRPSPIDSFENCGLSQTLVDNIKRTWPLKSHPTRYEKYVVPIIKRGKSIMDSSDSRNAKTSAFLIPVINHLLEKNVFHQSKKATNKPEVVVITPSRDSASDVFTMASELVQETELKVVLASGETSLQQQIQELKEGCNILIATPGRLLFLARGLAVSFQSVKVLVLDAADRLISEEFQACMENVVNTGGMSPVASRQTLMFSQHLTDEYQEKAQSFIDESYVFVSTLNDQYDCHGKNIDLGMYNSFISIIVFKFLFRLFPSG